MRNNKKVAHPLSTPHCHWNNGRAQTRLLRGTCTLPPCRCFLPDLTGFKGMHCTKPSSQHANRKAQHGADKTLEREFGPAMADCRYRAPPAPRLVQLGQL